MFVLQIPETQAIRIVLPIKEGDLIWRLIN